MKRVVVSWPTAAVLFAAVMAAPYFVSESAQGALYLVLMVPPLLGAIHNFRRHRIAHFLMASVIFAQFCLFVLAGDLIIQGPDRAGPIGLIGVGMACVGYMSAAVGLTQIRRPLHWRDGLLDATAALIAVSALQWQWQQSKEQSESVTNFLLPLLAAVLMVGTVTVLWRLLWDRRQNRTVIRIFVAASIFMTVSVLATSTYAATSPPLWAYGFGYWSALLLGMGLWHPDLKLIFQEELDYGKRLSVMRWLGPAMALMVTPGIMFALLASEQAPSAAVAFAAVLLTLTVLWRVGRLLHERESGRRELSDSELRFRSLVQNSADVIAVVDDELTLISISGGVSELFGDEANALLDQPASSVFDNADLEAVRRAFDATKEIEGCSANLGSDLRIIRKDNAERWVSIRATNHRHNAAVGGWVLNIHDVTDRRQAEAALSRLALHDSLTGLPNRTQMRDRLDHWVADTKRPVALLFCDLDGFKAVNDGLGHEHGDEVLRLVAGRWSAQLRPNDILGRWGGDEFLVMCPDVSTVEDATIIADRLLDALSQPLRVDGQWVTLGCSVGLAFSNDGESVDAMISRADHAMYAAKRTSGGLKLA